MADLTLSAVQHTGEWNITHWPDGDPEGRAQVAVQLDPIQASETTGNLKGASADAGTVVELYVESGVGYGHNDLPVRGIFRDTKLAGVLELLSFNDADSMVGTLHGADSTGAAKDHAVVFERNRKTSK